MLVIYAEQVAFAVTVRTTKANHCFVLQANFPCYFAFFSLGGFFEKHFQDFRCVIIQEVVDVPELALLFPAMSGYSLFQIDLCGANVSIQASYEVPFA